MKKLFILASSLFLSSLMIGATPVSGIKSINNNSESTYKTSKEEILSIKDRLGIYNRFLEIIDDTNTSQSISDNHELSYLYSKNILGRELSINYTDLNVTTTTTPSYNNSSTIQRSDFLIALSKSVYGIIESRPLVFRTTPTRDGESLTISSRVPIDYKGEEIEFDYTYGDYNIFITPNVYEQYFVKLIENNVISLKDFSNLNFINDFNSKGTLINNSIFTPSWSNTLGIYSSPQENSKVLGDKFNITKDKVEFVGNVQYLMDENLLKIDALKFIESILRTNEKDMTDLEAEIINYKYGSSYLSRLDENSKRTVMFLVAKGILNLDNDEEFLDLYKNLNSDTMITLLYRVANKDARLNFSEIQLTDSDNYWLSLGYYKNDVEFIESDYQVIESSVEEVTSQSKIKSALFGLIKYNPNKYADGTTRDFKVTKKFKLDNNTVKYYFNSKQLTKDTKEKDNEMFTKVSYGGNVLTIEMSVKANSSTKALAMVDSYISVDNNGAKSYGKISGVSTIDLGDNKKEIFISKTGLMKLKDLPIEIINDKLLKNKQTGARAILLENNNLAIVGNEIINTRETMVYSYNNEVYYNLDIIVRLLSQSAISDASLGTVITYKNLNSITTDNVYSVKDSTGRDAGTTWIDSINQSKIGEKTDYGTYPHLNITNDTVTGNFLIYNLKDDLGIAENVYMVLRFSYGLPNVMDFSYSDTGSYDNLLRHKLTISDVYNETYKRPDSSNRGLQKWWDSNIEFNNTLVNYMLGTDGLSYFSSGFIKANVDILYTTTKSMNLDIINKFFTDTIGLSKTFISSYGETDKSKTFTENFFTYKYNTIPDSIKIYEKLKSNREINLIEASVMTTEQQIDGYTHYGSQYALSPSKQLFLNLSNDKYIKADTKAKTLTITYKETFKSNLYVGGEYTLPTIEGNPLNNLKLVSTDYLGENVFVADKPLIAKIDEEDGEIIVKGKYSDNKYYNINKLMEMYYSEYPNHVQADSSGKQKTIAFIEETMGSSAGSIPSSYEVKNNDLFYTGGMVYKVIIDKKGVKSIDYGSPKDYVGKEVKYFPQITLNSSFIQADSNSEIKVKITNPSYSIEGLVSSGISGQIIDSFMYASSEYVNISKIPNLSKVYIGGVAYVKSSNKLKSDVYTDTDLTTQMISSGTLTVSSNTAVSQAVMKAIGNVSLLNKTNNSKGNTFTDFIDNPSIDSGLESSSFNNTLAVGKDGKLVINTGSSSKEYTSSSTFTSFAFSFGVSDKIKFMKVKDGVYELVTVVNTGAPGYLNDVPFFVESLDFKDDTGLFSTLDKKPFEKASNSDSVIEKYLISFRKRTVEDVIGLVTYLVSVGLGVLSVLNLIAMTFHAVGFTNSLKIIYDNGQRWYYDIYAVITLGLQSVNRDMSVLTRIFIALVLMILAILVNLV